MKLNDEARLLLRLRHLRMLRGYTRDAQIVVAPNDLLAVISYLNAHGAGEGEAVSSGGTSDTGGSTAEVHGGETPDDIVMLLAMDAAAQGQKKR